MAVKRAALYIRVSTDEQARHGYSLGEQRADLESFATAKGYAVIGVYADEGVSARKAMSRRKELRRLLDDVEADKVDIIIVKCLDRWFRNVADFYKVQELLDKHHVEWQCTQEDIDTTTTTGRLTLNMRLSIAQHESDQTGDRIRYINEGKRRRHEACSGKVPLGIRIRNKHYEPDENASMVKFLFEYIAAGRAKRSAINEMKNRFGIILTWEQASRTLTNKIYIGEVRGIAGYCPAIIPDSLFYRVQEITARNVKAAPTGRIYLFSGLIRCPCCGRILVGTRGNRSRIDGEFHNFGYRCNKRRTSSTPQIGDCGYGGTVFEKSLEGYLLENIQNLAKSYAHDVELQRQQGGADNHAKLAAVQGKLKRLNELYIDGMIDRETHDSEHHRLKTQERELASAIARQPGIPTNLTQIIDTADLGAEYSTLSREHKKDLWQKLIERIEFDATPPMQQAHARKTYRVIFRPN